jgi:hypothetical protein
MKRTELKRTSFKRSGKGPSQHGADSPCWRSRLTETRTRGIVKRLKRKVDGSVVEAEIGKKKRKKSDRTKRIELLDTLFSGAIRLRDNFTCQRCGHQNKSAQTAHIWTRNNYSTRWDMENAMCLCYMCHIKGFHSAHREPAEFIEWVHNRMGDERWEALKTRSMATVKVNGVFMDETEQNLREYVARF